MAIIRWESREALLKHFWSKYPKGTDASVIRAAEACEKDFMSLRLTLPAPGQYLSEHVVDEDGTRRSDEVPVEWTVWFRLDHYGKLKDLDAVLGPIPRRNGHR